MNLPRFRFVGDDGKPVAGVVLQHDTKVLRLLVDTVNGRRLAKPFEEHGAGDDLPKGWEMETISGPLDEYRQFLLKKRVSAALAGFEVADEDLNPHLFPYQRSITRRALRLGRSAIFAACVGAEATLHSPDGDVSFGDAYERGTPMRVFSLDEGRVVIANASAPFINGVNSIYEFTLASGRTIRATLRHRFLTCHGWKRGDSLRFGERLRVSDASRLQSNSGLYRAVRGADGQNSTRTLGDYQDGYSPYPRRCDELPLQERDSARELTPSLVGAREHTQRNWNTDVQGNGSTHNRQCQTALHPSTAHSSGRVETIAGDAVSPLLSSGHEYTPWNIRTSRKVHVSSNPLKPTHGLHPSATLLNADGQFSAFEDSLSEWDTLVAVNYIRDDIFFDIEVPGPANYLADGVWSHNCGLGKTLMQLSWAEPVTRHTGKPVLVLAPLNVVNQTVREGARFEVPVTPCRSQTDVRAGVNITNYEMLDHFDPDAFGGVVLDESSLIKNWTGKTREKLEASFDLTPYKLCCTATPAPNDHLELGNHAQFLRVMQSGEMLSRWFINDTMRAGGYRLKSHAADDFWRWMASWAATLERPSDLGYSDVGFDIPPMDIITHTIDAGMPACADGELFGNATLSATTMHREMRRTAAARAEEVARIVNGDRDTWVVWCNTNYEADELAARIPDAVDVRGSMPPKQKEQALADFVDGKTRVLLTKPAIGGYGLNLQYVCHKMIFVGLSYSYEDFHQCLCRSWRFGQAHTVEAHLVAAETEGAIRSAIDRKRAAHREMHEAMVHAMRQAEMGAENGQIGLLKYDAQLKMELPHWLKGTR